MYDWTSVLAFTVRIRNVGQCSLSFMERQTEFSMNSPRCVSEVLPRGPVKV